MLKISIVTVCYNAEKTIERTIQSVINQKDAKIEYLIIDGASQDKTLDIIQSYQSGIGIVVSEPDRGLYHAMNKGIAKASGDYVYFLNADDYLVNELVIQSVTNFLIKHPDIDVVYGNLQVRYPHREPSLHRPPPPEQILDELICGALPHQATFARRSVLEAMGGFEEQYRIAADYDWFLRLTQQPNVKIGYMPITVASYAIDGQSAQMTKVLPEVYRIQNQFSPYQTPEWQQRRILAYQKQITELRQQESQWSETLAQLTVGGSEEVEIQTLIAKLQAAQATIEAMKTSKFWALRQKWFQAKKFLGLPGDIES
ncbi:glycosyltransferase family 2 protein [Synechococcus sp. PCC 6312]|uniref:glycosyltransferase family 2 protein n=1 Tax=Synechococcus sp. (strain ATCC 27167 / PCC 6312) TaxID=195253 RepID=UPI00029ED443|nr:glycosyltransferase family 2 protein [Synechococcus sp. PCC 6312]AFY60489.1 glycosyl transferase [Synechococcus sp. PCC 6312]